MRRAEKNQPTKPTRPKFYADHNFPQDFVAFLRHDGRPKIKIVTAQELGYASRDDGFHFAYAAQKGYVLLTLDRDYLNDQLFPIDETAGLVVFAGQAGEKPLAVAQGFFQLQRIYKGAPAIAWRHKKHEISAQSLVIKERTDTQVIRVRFHWDDHRSFLATRCPRCREDVEVVIADVMQCRKCGRDFTFDHVYHPERIRE